MRRVYFAVAAVTLATVLAGSLSSGAGARSAPREAVATAHVGARAPDDAGPATHTITYDQYSLMIDGQRTVIWSGEFEYWRLPSPSLWLDILQKMKAEGYNAVTIYFDWAYHSPKSGVYDFSRRARRRQAARHGGTGRPLRDRAAGPVHQRRDERGRTARVADHSGRQGPHERARL